MADLRNKKIHELRSIAQGFGIADIFSKTDIQLIQAIELKQQDLAPKPTINIPKPEYDARLMTKPPSKMVIEGELMELLKPYIDRGLHFTRIDEETWEMVRGPVVDTGSFRMPLRVILDCAARMMR